MSFEMSQSKTSISGPPHMSRPLDDLLLRTVDGGLAGVLLFAPWFMGGRHPLGQLVLVLLSITVALAWVTRQVIMRGQTVWKVSACELVILAAIGLVALQLTPLPSELLQSLSPHATKLLPLWMPGAQPPDALGTWNQISMTPDATRAGLIMLLSYGMLFLVTLQRIETIDDVERLLRWFAISTILMASVGLLQYLTSNGKFLWVYEHPFRDTHDAVKGPFINKNHFCHLLALGLGPLVWSIQRAMSRVRAAREPSFQSGGVTNSDLEWFVMAQSIGLGLVMFAGLMTLSRGGAMAMCAALAVSGGLLFRAKAISGSLIIAFLGLTTLVGGALAIHGYQRVSDRLDDFTAGTVEELDTQGYRRKLWRADLDAARDFATLGSGVGSHRDVYRMYLPETWNMEMTHAENGYLQVAMETGVPGFTLLLIGIGLASFWCLESLRNTKNKRAYFAAAAVASGLVASIVHSWSDFVWYISACMSATVLLLACACRLMEISREGRERWVWLHWRISRPSLAIAAAIIVCLGGWMVNNRFRSTMASPHWDEYMRFVTSPENEHGDVVPSEGLVNHLRNVIKWTPEDPRAHAAIARSILKRFGEMQATSLNPMPLTQLRDAAIRSHFASRKDLNSWLHRAVGDHYTDLDQALFHTRRSLTLGPLRGEAYVFLAELCFLENAMPETKEAFLQQALKIAPYSSDILIAVGAEAILAGEGDRAIEYWKRGFDQSPHTREMLIKTAAESGIDAVNFMSIFKPGWPEIGLVYKTYAKMSPPDHVKQLREAFLAAAEVALPKLSRKEVADAYFQMFKIFKETGLRERALDCVDRAVQAAPENLAYRHNFALELRDTENYEAAEKQLNWCLQRVPSNKVMRDQLAEVVKLRIGSSTRAASREGIDSRSSFGG
jgi:tetratricopeptide (TPR) repeat protein